MSPSYRIVFYVSGHGFGHTSRAIEVIRAVLRARPDAAHRRENRRRRAGCSRAPSTGAASSSSCSATPGMVQIDSLSIDTAESIRQAVEFHEARAAASPPTEAAYLRDSGARVVVGDIPPLAIAAAARGRHPVGRDRQFHLGLDLRGLSRRAPRRARARRSARLYRTATARPSTAHGRRLRRARLGDARHPVHRAAARSARRTKCARALGLPPRAGGKPLVLMSFGGYGVAGLDTSALSRL